MFDVTAEYCGSEKRKCFLATGGSVNIASAMLDILYSVLVLLCLVYKQVILFQGQNNLPLNKESY